MAIRDASLQRALKEGNIWKARLIRKSNEQWELAGQARQDGDHEAELKYTEEARRLMREAAGE